MGTTESGVVWPRLRGPVRRQGAERYLLLTLFSFAGSVSATRLFLEMTGYPQLGGGGLHIAHVLWGGLLLFVGALLPVVFANRWVYDAAAISAGLGVGLFIDEVGKFITETNDYFFPAAAPIVYALFLLTVLLYQQARPGPSSDVRAELYRALDGLAEWLDHGLERREKAEMSARLQWIAGRSQESGPANLAGALLDFLETESLGSPPARAAWPERMARAARLRFRRLATEPRLRIVCVGGLVGLGLLSLKNPAQVLLAGTLPGAAQLLAGLTAGRVMTVDGGSPWFLSRVVLEVAAGLTLLVGGGLLLRPGNRWGANLGYAGLLLSLAVVDVLVFYYEQFSTILTATFQLAALLAVLEYRRRYVA